MCGRRRPRRPGPGVGDPPPVDLLAARAGRGGGHRFGAGRRRRDRAADVHLVARPRGGDARERGVRRGRPARGRRRRCRHLAVVGSAARGRPPAGHARVVRRRAPRSERAAGALGRAGAHQPSAGGVAAPRGAARGLSARADLVGLPRPAHAAGRHAGDGRGARGRDGRGPGALPPADPRRGRPDGADGRRPVRAVADPRGRADPEPGDGGADRRRQRGDRRCRPDGAGAVGAARRQRRAGARGDARTRSGCPG